MGNKTTVAINFQGLNLDTILANLKEINTLSGKVQLPKNLIDQINDLTQAVEAMKASTATLGKTKVDSKEYKEFVANITKAFNELNQRVTVLEQAMTTIGKSQDVSGIVNSINKIKDNAVEATDAINKMNETTNMVSKNRTTAKSIDIKSYQKLLDLFTKIKELEDSSIGDNSAIGKKANSMTSKTVIKNLREQLELAQDLQAELDNIYSSKNLGNGKKFFEIAEQLKSTLNIIDKLQARYESINGEGTLAKIEFAPGFKTNMDESIVDVENGFRDFIKDISKQVDIVNKKIATIPQQTKEVSKEIKQSSDSTKSETQEGLSLGKTKYSKSKSQITIPLHLRKDEYEKFKKEIDAILEQIQDNIKPLEVRVALVSGYKTKKTEELASQLQSDLSNIDDKEIREKVSGLIDNLQKSFDTDLHMKIEIEGGKEATDIVKKVVKELKAELKKGIKSTNIDAEFGEKTLEKLNKQLSTIKPIRVNLGKDEEEVGKEYAPLTLLKKTIDNIKKSITEKTDAFKEEVKTVETQSALEVKYLTPLIDSFLTLKEVLSDITSLSGQIGDVKFSIDSDNLSKLVQISTIVSDVVNETIDTSANKKKRQINNKPSKASKNNTDIQKENVALEKQNTLEKATVDIIKEKNKAKEKEEKISENILGLTKEEIAWAQSVDIGDSAGFLSSEELEKELTIARELSSEYKEQGKQQKLTNEEIENGFQIIKKYVNSDQYGNYNLSKKKDKEWLTFWTDRYIKYQEAGGQRPISDLTDNKKILEKYQKEYDKQKSSFINGNSILATNEKVKELKTDLKGAEKELDTFYKILIGVPQQFEEARDNLVKMIEDGLITGLDAAKKLNKEISLIKLKEEQSEKSFQEIKKTITDKGNYNLRKQSDRNELSKIVEQFITYQQKEGKHPLSDLTDNQKLLDKLDKEYQKQYSTIANSAPISAKEVSEVTEEISEANKQLDIFYKMLISVPEKFENIRDDFDSKVRNGLLSGVEAAKEINKQMSLYKLHLKETEENYKKQSKSFEERFINEGYDNTKLSKLLDDIEETKSKLHQEYDATGGSKDAEGLVTIYNNLDKLSEQITDTLKKNATISNDITSETKNEVVQTQEVSKFVGKTNEELQQCLVNEEKWLKRCKEGSDAYNHRKENIEEINALLSASITNENPVLSSKKDTEIIVDQSKLLSANLSDVLDLFLKIDRTIVNMSNGSFDKLIERSFVWSSKTGEHTAFNAVGEHNRATSYFDYKKNGLIGKFDSGMHTHPEDYIRFSLPSIKDKEGDLAAWLNAWIDGINTQFIIGLKDVLQFDADKFFSDIIEHAHHYEKDGEVQVDMKSYIDNFSQWLTNNQNYFSKQILPKNFLAKFTSSKEIYLNFIQNLLDNSEQISKIFGEDFAIPNINEINISISNLKNAENSIQEYVKSTFSPDLLKTIGDGNKEEIAKSVLKFYAYFAKYLNQLGDNIDSNTTSYETQYRKLYGKKLEEVQETAFNYVMDNFVKNGKQFSDYFKRYDTDDFINNYWKNYIPNEYNLSSDTNRITEQARAEMQAEEAAYDARVKAEAAAKREMESEEAAYDASVRAKVEAERAGEAIAESQDRAQKELLNTVSILEELNKLVSPTKIASSKNIQGFNDSLGGLFGDNKSFEKTLRILKEWLKTFNEVKKNGSRTIGNFGAISSVTDAKFIENQNSLAQKLGYNIKWNTDDQGYLHGIVSESENAVKSLDEVFERIFNINELVAKSNKTPDSSKIDSIKDESKVIEQQTVKIEENTKAQRENKNEKSNADPKVNLTNEMAKTGSDSIDGLTEGIKAKEQQYFDTMEGVMQEGVNIARKTIGAESPARKYIKVSEDAVDGLIVGLKNKEEEYFTAIREMMQKATSIIQEETANIGQDVKFGEGLENANKYLQELSKTLKLLSDGKSDKRIQQIQKNLEGLKNTFANFKSRKNGLLTQIESILEKGDELKSLSNILKNSQKSIDSATKAFDKKQADNQAKAKASENLSKYEEDINKGLQEIVTKNQWTVLSSQIEPYKDGLVHVTALIKDLEGKYKELIYTTENGKVFNSESIKETDISINKKAQAFEKYQQMLERLNIGAEAIGEVTPESDNWQRLVDLMEEFGIEAENAVRIIRQVDEVGHESFQVFDALGNKKTIGVSSKDLLAIKETVNDSSKAIKEYNDLIQSLAKYSKKNFNLSNLEAQQFLDTLNKFPSAWKQIQSGVNAGSISSDDFIKLRESYNTVLKDFQNEWFSEKQLPRIRPEYISQYKELKNDLDNIILAMQNSPDFPQQDSISSLSEFINKAKEFYKIQDQINIKMTDSGTVDKLLGKIGDNLVRNSSMSRELSNNFKDLRDRIKSMRDATNGMLPTDEFNKFNAEFQELVRIMKETGQTGLGFFDLVGQKIKGISASLIAQYLSLQDWIRYFRTAFETIHQLDTALVDLKKTTTMSNSELEDFYHNSSRLAKQMGVSSEEIINQASAWSRLGYSSKDAAETMAQLSSQFAKISPGTSVEDATDYLVSTMKAFNYDYTQVESEIMDSINRIGNTMATTNAEVGEMLKRSSATMAAANNSLAETIALESAAVQITRNAETTGINSAA